MQLETGSIPGAGTDADLWLTAKATGGGNPCADRTPCRFRLNYGPAEDTPGLSSVQKDLLDWNDFEISSNATYVVGPFSALPAALEIHNDAPKAQDIAAQAAADFGNAVEDGVEVMKDALLNLIAGHADLVGTQILELEADDLPASGSEEAFTVRVDGGVEGDYRVRGSIRNLGPKEGGTQYEVEVLDLECIEEAFTDQRPDPRDRSLDKSDEPFVFSMVVPFGDTAKAQRKGPFDNTHTGSKHKLDLTWQVVVPPYGSMSIVAQAWESDSETPSDRAQLFDTFKAKIEEARQEARSHHDFVTMLGEAVAAEWYLERIEVYAFRRSPKVATGALLGQTANRWLRGGETASFALNAASLTEWPVSIATLESPSAGKAVAPIGVPFKKSPVTNKPVPERPKGGEPAKERPDPRESAGESVLRGERPPASVEGAPAQTMERLAPHDPDKPAPRAVEKTAPATDSPKKQLIPNKPVEVR
ncbi:MAG: hypothetical protein ACREDO_00525 [Methyloceanibacter sp.]